MSKEVLIPIPKHTPWTTQLLVIRALLIREITTRFGKYRLGLFWMLVEPLFTVIIVGLLLGQLIGKHIPQIPYSFFILNGLMILKLFNNPLASGLHALKSNKGLLVYPSVRLLDPFIARFLFELMSTVFSFSLFCVVALWLGVSLSLEALHILAAAFLLTWLIGCGFGLIFGVAVAYYPEAEKVAGVLQRPLFFISAVMYSTSHLPQTAQDYILLNPIVHTIELCRQALFPYYQVAGVNLAYPSVFAAIAMGTGMMLFHNHRKYLAQR